MKESGLKIRLMAPEFTSGQMAENITANGKIIICMAKVFTPGKMAVCTKETMKMTANTAMEYTHGTMVNNMKAGGKMENSTEKESIGKMDVIEEESGKMERELSGSMTSTKILTLTDKAIIKSQAKQLDNSDTFLPEFRF